MSHAQYAELFDLKRSVHDLIADNPDINFLNSKKAIARRKGKVIRTTYHTFLNALRFDEGLRVAGGHKRPKVTVLTSIFI